MVMLVADGFSYDLPWFTPLPSNAVESRAAGCLRAACCRWQSPWSSPLWSFSGLILLAAPVLGYFRGFLPFFFGCCCAFVWVLFRFYLGVVAFCLRSLSPGLIGLMVRLSACTAGRVCQTQQPGSRHRNRDHAGPLLLLPNRRPLHAGVLRCQPTRPRRPGRSHVGTGGAAMAHPLLMCWVEFFFFAMLPAGATFTHHPPSLLPSQFHNVYLDSRISSTTCSRGW